MGLLEAFRAGRVLAAGRCLHQPPAPEPSVWECCGECPPVTLILGASPADLAQHKADHYGRCHAR
jgi:hypothetical protein